jgi:hypothetical protein
MGTTGIPSCGGLTLKQTYEKEPRKLGRKHKKSTPLKEASAEQGVYPYNKTRKKQHY